LTFKIFFKSMKNKCLGKLFRQIAA